MSSTLPPEGEKKKKKEKDLKRGHAAPAVLGRYQNVLLSAGELSELQADFPTVCQEYIERLSEYMASTGKQYRSHAATIRRWPRRTGARAAYPTIRARRARAYE